MGSIIVVLVKHHMISLKLGHFMSCAVSIIDVEKKEHISMENSKIFETLEKIKCDE